MTRAFPRSIACEQVLRRLVVEVLQDKPSEKVLFRNWREGQQRADAAAGSNAGFEMEEDQASG